MRFSRSRENVRLVAASARHSPLSCASDRATMCFYIGVSLRVKLLARIGTEDAAEPLDDVIFDGLRICVLITAIQSAPMLRGDYQAAPLRCRRQRHRPGCGAPAEE